MKVLNLSKRDQSVYDAIASEGPLMIAGLVRRFGAFPKATIRRLVEAGHVREFIDPVVGVWFYGITTRPEAHDWAGAGLGERPDTEIAEELGCTASAVWRARQRRGVAAFRGVGRPRGG